MLLIVVIKFSINILRISSDYLPCSSSRSHCCVETLVIPLSFVIFPGLYAFMINTLFWFFPSMVMTDSSYRPSESCPDLVTLWLKVFVTIMAIPPGFILIAMWGLSLMWLGFFLTRISWLLFAWFYYLRIQIDQQRIC